MFWNVSGTTAVLSIENSPERGLSNGSTASYNSDASALEEEAITGIPQETEVRVLDIDEIPDNVEIAYAIPDQQPSAPLIEIPEVIHIRHFSNEADEEESSTTPHFTSKYPIHKSTKHITLHKLLSRIDEFINSST
jgi:hypothetical protein